MGGCTFFFNVQVKSAPLLMGQNACAERGVLPRSSDTLKSLVVLHVLVMTEYFLPEDFKETHL